MAPIPHTHLTAVGVSSSGAAPDAAPQVVRPSTDPELFTYIQPLVVESLRALDALPPDGPADPKVLMRVDWGAGEPLLPFLPSGAQLATEISFGGSVQGGGAEGGSMGSSRKQSGKESGSLKRAIVMRAGSLGPPQKKLKAAMERGTARLGGKQGHFINEVELHPVGSQ